MDQQIVIVKAQLIVIVKALLRVLKMEKVKTQVMDQ